MLQDPGSILGIRTPVQGSKRGSVVANAISTVLVDPPRAGLDEVTLRACAGFDRVLYISCNPDTLEPALRTLLETHDLKRMALLDHFPYTSHVECGVYLTAHR